MSGKYLGEAFDIHGGGIDLRFPHHENELAQSAAAGRAFAHYWMHNAWVTMSGEKMSKSLGNTARVSEVTASHDPRAVRYFLLAPHYRSTIEFSPSDEHTQGSLDEADKAIARIDGFLERAGQVCDRAGIDPTNLPTDAQVPELDERFTRAMDDDLGTPAAVATLFTTINEGNKAIDASDAPAVAAHLGQLRVMLGVLGLDPDDPVWASSRSTQSDKLEPVVDGLVQAMLTQRSEARARKDWATADSIRDVLTHLGLVIEDTPDGARWSLD